MIVQYQDQVILIQMQKVMKEEAEKGRQVIMSHIPSREPIRISNIPFQSEQKIRDFPTVSHSGSYPPLYWPFDNHHQAPYPPFHDPYYMNPFLWNHSPFFRPPFEEFMPRIQESKLIVTRVGSSTDVPVKEEPHEQPKDSTQSQRVEENEIQKMPKRYRRVNTPNYYWSLEQNKRYIQFLKTHLKLFDLSLSEKKNMKINVMMSKKVKTRNSYQCRSHHQKMIKKYGNIENLLKSMTQELAIFSKMANLPNNQKQPPRQSKKQQAPVKLQNSELSK